MTMRGERGPSLAQSGRGGGLLGAVAAVVVGAVVTPSCSVGLDVVLGREPGGVGGAGGVGAPDEGGAGSLAAFAGSDGGVGEPGECGAAPCANHSGTRDFIADGTDPTAADRFAQATEVGVGADSGRTPSLVYPSHETMFPINVSRIRHEWTLTADDALYRMRFVGSRTTVNVYTAALDWTPNEEAWDWIAESNRGGSVEVTVSSWEPRAPTEFRTSAPITVHFSRAAVEGAIYYWSTGTEGIMKALVSDPVPVKFYTDPSAADGETCVACHTLSRDGKRLAVGYDGEWLRQVSVPERETILGDPDPLRSAWTTFSPDGELLLVAAGGILTLIDSDTGVPVGPDGGVVPIPAGVVATHPDWSALGDRVAITLGTKGGNKDVEGGSIAILPYDAGVWGTPEVIVQSLGVDDNNFFPVWSPDSRTLAYVHAPEKSKDAVGATLRLIPAEGGTPIILRRLNERVAQDDGVTGIGNSMPTWAPSTRPGTFWLAFSSLRAYATVRPQDEKADQIWIAAIDPAAPDPSYAAFWAPFQSVEDGNHRAFWTHTEEDTQCGCVDRCGDGIDNDCDGTADEADCVVCQSVEVCGDGVDNDCDCVVDECNREDCNDGIDNDGDGLADDLDPSCDPLR